MVQGTGSSVGKSFIVAGLCRYYAKLGLKVAPFKAQNMALNAAVTASGHEIGRAQAAQAMAAGIEPTIEMNPILLKPEADSRSQVIYLGRSIGSYAASDYLELRRQLWPGVVRSLRSLQRDHDLVILEGAGSPVELNLRRGEIVNMRMAAVANSPVILVGDIERGGIFASMLGTLDLLCARDRARVRGLLVNRFRGDRSLFEGGARLLARRSGLPVLGVVPYLPGLGLPAEDSLELTEVQSVKRSGALDVALVATERISNFDEFQLLAREPVVSLRLVRSSSELGQPDLIIIPGTKMTASDLLALRRANMSTAIVQAAATGSAVIGICGGYQILGEVIRDIQGVELKGAHPGLALLPVQTDFDAPAKITRRNQGEVVAGHGLLGYARGLKVQGYEIRFGRLATRGVAAWQLNQEPEGCLSSDGWILGTSLHGLFDNHELRAAILHALTDRKGLAPPRPGVLTDPFEAASRALMLSMDLRRLETVIWPSERSS